MATDLCVQYNVGASLKMNEPNVTTIIPTEILGLDGRPIRATILPNGAADGGDKLTARFGPRLISVTGIIAAYSGGNPVTPVDNMTTYLTQVNTLIDAWITGLEAAINSTFTLNFTPTGLSAVNKTVSYGYEEAEFQSTGRPEDGPTQVKFGLVCESG
jgi:hypothetical protein